jgi:phosphatidylinositol alpha-1,6-mannosyltransferase
LRNKHWLARPVKVNVLCLVTEAYGGKGGIACAARDFLDALANDSRVSSIEVLPRLTAEFGFHTPPKVQQFAARPGRLAYAARSFLALRKKIDLVFCNHLFMAPLGALIAKLSGANLVIQVHGIEVWPRLSWARRLALEAADCIVSVSRDTRARVLTQCDMPPETVLVIPNTVSEQFRPVDRPSAKSKFGLTAGPVLLSVGRLNTSERYKGQDLVIRALNDLIPDFPSILFLIAGDGDDRVRLEALVEDEKIGEHVHFLGQVKQEDLNDLYNAADLFALPSTGEGFGIVFLEAMAAGTPAIGLNVAGASDALADGALGWCVREDQFAETLKLALSKPSPDPKHLAATVHQRFSKKMFEAAIANLLTRLQA